MLGSPMSSPLRRGADATTTLLDLAARFESLATAAEVRYASPPRGTSETRSYDAFDAADKNKDGVLSR